MTLSSIGGKGYKVDIYSIHKERIRYGESAGEGYMEERRRCEGAWKGDCYVRERFKEGTPGRWLERRLIREEKD
jgi:hypothetical protein